MRVAIPNVPLGLWWRELFTESFGGKGKRGQKHQYSPKLDFPRRIFKMPRELQQCHAGLAAEMDVIPDDQGVIQRIANMYVAKGVFMVV